MSTVLTESRHAGGFLVGEYCPNKMAEVVTVASGQILGAGEVFGKVTKILAAAPIPSIVGTGTGAMSALSFGPDVQTGDYVVELLATSSTAAFEVTAPDGTRLSNGAVGTMYRSSHLDFLVSSGGTMTAGDKYTVTVTAGGTPAVVGGTGTGTMSAISLGPDAQNGGYRVICREVVANGGEFEVLAPNGASIGRFVMGTSSGGAASFTSRHVSFTLTDATDFIAGNYFNIIVAKGSGKAKAWAPTATDGTQAVAGILFAAADATDGDVKQVAVTRLAVVNTQELVFATSILSGEKELAYAQLRAMEIIPR